MSNMLHLARPNISDAEIQAVVEVLKTAHLSIGPKVTEFENAFAAYCGVEHAVACNAGTSALHMLIHALDIGPGDEVITTPFSFVASANCALMERAKAVFADVLPDTWCIDPAKVEAAITPRTKAIIPVDVFGQVCDMKAFMEIGKRRNIPIIEDSCEALGTMYHGKKAGSLGDAGVFGFYPNKQITTGEGGMVVTNNTELANLCRSLRNQGRDVHGTWLSHQRMGFNFRLSDINCALGLTQLRRAEEIISERTRVEKLYRERLSGEKRLTIQKITPGNDKVSWFVFVVRLADSYSGTQRDAILTSLRERNIGCSNYFAPIHLQPFYREKFGHKEGDFPVCEALAARTIALPFHHELSEADVDRVCRELVSLL